MLGINPTYMAGVSGCPECQYCRYLQCHGNNPGCRGGPWLCPLQHCGHTTPRASPVALLFSVDLQRPLNDYSLPLQLFRQHTADDSKVDHPELDSAVPQEYKRILENYASNSNMYNLMGNCGTAQQELKIKKKNQDAKQEPYKTLFEQSVKPQNINKIATVNEELDNRHKDQKLNAYSRNLESLGTHLPAIPEGIGVDADVKGRPTSKPIDIPRVMVSQHKEHSRRKSESQSPTRSSNTKNPKALMDINTCTVSQINQWSNKALNQQNTKHQKYDKKDDEHKSYMKEQYVIKKENQISGAQAVSPIPTTKNKEEINDYLTSYKVNQDVKINDKRINEGFYKVKPPLPLKGVDNDLIVTEVRSPIASSSHPASSFRKDSRRCSDVSSSSVNQGGHDKSSVPASPSRPHCVMPPMPDYGIAAGVSGAAHKELVATAVEGGIGGEDSELGAYWELLEEDIRPVQPLKHSHLSAQIFMEHKEMARNYLILQQELFNLQRQKLLLEEKLSHSEQLEQCTNHRYQEKIKQLMGKRDDLSNNHAHLKQQLEHIRSQEKRPRPFSTATQQHITMGASLQLHQPPP